MNTYRELSNRYHTAGTWGEIDEKKLWEALVLCILSSNVHYETATSAKEQLRYGGILEELRHTPSAKHIGIIAKELQRPIYLPRKVDGSFRRYRFPNMRANNIVGAAQVIYEQNDGLHKMLCGFSSAYEARDFLAAGIPGLGLKEASHFLRNIGYCSNLAIVDVHIISFLRQLRLLGRNNVSSITTKIYRRLEQIMLSIASVLNVNLAVLDMAIWHYMRNRGRNV